MDHQRSRSSMSEYDRYPRDTRRFQSNNNSLQNQSNDWSFEKGWFRTDPSEPSTSSSSVKRSDPLEASSSSALKPELRTTVSIAREHEKRGYDKLMNKLKYFGDTDIGKNFILTRITKSGSAEFYCKLCKVEGINYGYINNHISSRQHQNFLKAESDQGMPGPTPPPQHRKKYQPDKPTYLHKPMFNNLIDEVKDPLIGTTFIVEILDKTVREATYKCILCQKFCQQSTIVSHLIGKPHRTAYLNKHFPTVMAKLNTIPQFLLQKQTFLHEIAKKVERKFGRVMAEIYRGTQYKKVQAILEDDILRKNHGSETDIPNCLQYLIGEFETDLPQPPAFASPSKRIHEQLDNFRSDVFYETNKLENQLAVYEKDPESHPFYKREWQLFWKRKQDEAIARGDDPCNMNINAEWFAFFIKRIKELHQQDVDFKVEEIRLKYGLSIEDIENMNEPHAKKTRFSDYDPTAGPSTLTRTNTITVPPAPSTFFEKFQPIALKFFSQPQYKPVPEPIVTVISVCRLLTTLERDLGLLAPKILEFLSKSIAAEREQSKLSEDLLFNDENLNLIETCKEKLIGLLTADFLLPNKVKTVHMAIAEIGKLVDKQEVKIKVKEALDQMNRSVTSEELDTLTELCLKREGGVQSSTGGTNIGGNVNFNKKKKRKGDEPYWRDFNRSGEF